ncbi:hypothetical protein GCM10010981_22940 [Dyella nitratireducens]|uniref:Uncharacterized protein n=1 Tax=Dyella nitratireducens TaxID=1849580 RepID=A0ABQ1FZ16_9GAMM|nr:hypothetical protein GCM10010981_22940 [Dyella nitratireducens]GLQ40728.1 hypothetical protein GCM10007902_05780 [Dyella nitratireducens]
MNAYAQCLQTEGRYLFDNVLEEQVQLIASLDAIAEKTSVEPLMAVLAWGPLYVMVICPTGTTLTLETYLPDMELAFAKPAD